MTKKIRLKDGMVGLQLQMDAKLTLSRRTLTHPGAIGDVAELEWIALLSDYLPRRYSVDKGFAVDHKGFVSDQIDALIYDRQYTPFVLHMNGVKYIPAEAIYGALECKQDLSTKHLKYASAKAKSIRRLSRTSLPIVHAGGELPAKQPHNILFGLVGVSGKLGSLAKKHLENAASIECINYCCSLSGTYAHLDNYSPFHKVSPPFEFTVTQDNLSLLRFVLGLVTDLQRIGTVPAIDIQSYLSSN